MMHAFDAISPASLSFKTEAQCAEFAESFAEKGDMSRNRVGAALVVVSMVGAGIFWVARSPKPGASTRKAGKLVAALRAMPSSPLRASQQASAPGVVRADDRTRTRVTLPERSTEPLRLEELRTGMAIDVQVRNVSNVAAQSGDGYYVYPHAHASGGTLLHRLTDDGVEDFVSFETRPAVPEVVYDLALENGVSGLRLVEGTLELLDDEGTPRLRAAPPFIVGADGARTEATLAVEGCAVDNDPAAPWGRAVTDPGADSCTLRVHWPDAEVKYPAVLDPRWTTTGSLTTPRQGHTATLLSTGNVLVVGGTSNGTTALASAELYNQSTGTWALTASMTGARTLHTATQLKTNSNSTTSGKVLIAGGLNGSTSQNTAQLYSPTTGTWTAAANLNAARHADTATLLADGRVLVAGGLNGTTTLATAALYNSASGTGTWTATTGPIPPAGLKNHVAVLLTTTNNQLSNKVLLVGGNNGTSTIASVFLFDPTQSAFSTLAALPSPREGHTATVLANGNILITGGKNGSTVLATTMVFNPSSGMGTWTSAGTMTTARQLHAAVLLPSGIVANGQVLVAGGNNGTSTLGTAELWNGTSTWTATSALQAPVQGETATVLSNNMVLIAGGVNGSTTVAAADLYDASFALACTSNSQCATGFCANGVCCDTACNGGCGVCNLAGKVGTCSAASSTTVCRAQNGACDVAETCNGTSLTCPADAVAVLGTVCRGQNGICDVPETCNGTTKTCPADGFAPTTTVCRASTSTCDAPETCTGTSATCPADKFAPATTVCRPAAGGCDAAETCTGTSSICPPDGLAAAGTLCRPAESLCDVAESCTGASAACPTDTFAAAGTTCGAGSPAPVCSGLAGTCPESGATSDILGFEALADWTFASGATASIVGLNPSRTQGESSFEVTAQNSARLNSTPMSSIGTVGTTVLLDITLPTSQANPSSLGDVQMYVNSPSLGISNVSLGDVGLTGLALGTWQTLAFQMPAATVTTIAHGVYSDLTFSIVLNVASTETGHYLLDNVRSVSDVVPSLLGVAKDGATLKAIFGYQTTSSTPVSIPYGTANGLTNQSGFIAAPLEVPPTTFVPTTHAPFVATLSGSLLTWTVGSHSVTATPSSQQLPVTPNGDGTSDAALPGGQKVNIDSVPPPNPGNVVGPQLGAPFTPVLNGTFAVSPSGAASYTVPIAISPGISGMAPNLSLTYSSQGADGIAGQGWGLGGLSMITRCPRTRQQDGYGRPVMMDSLTQPQTNTDQLSDGICLDGQKLFDTQPGGALPTGGTCPSGAAMCYTPEREDFSTITLNGSGEFQVVTKTGETRYYGLQTVDRVHDSSPTPQTAIWLLDEVVDGWGNFFDLKYNNGAANFTDSGVWVSAIDYTGSFGGVSQGGSNGGFISPFNTITFQYEGRSDTRWTRYASLRIPQNQRLKSITAPQGVYCLTYMQETPQANGACVPATTPTPGLSELQTIGYCAGASCMQPLTFSWQGGQKGAWTRNANYALPTQYVGTGKGLKGTQFIDVDGDGLLDFVLARQNGIGGTNSPQSVTLLNTGNGWATQPLTGPTQTFPVYLTDANDNPTGAELADMDGDGKPDIIVDFANVMCNPVQVGGAQTLNCISCGVGQSCSGSAKGYSPAVWLNRFTPGGGGGWEFHGEYGIMPPAQTNSVITDNSAIRFVNTSEPVQVADMDGDGKADLIFAQAAILSEIQHPNILLNEEIPGDVGANDGTGQVSPWALQVLPNLFTVGPKDNLPSVTQVQFLPQDMNRDGLPDLVYNEFFTYPDGSVDSTSWTFVNTTGSASLGEVALSPTPVVHIASQTNANLVGGLQRPVQFADVDGDGFYDMVSYYSTFGIAGSQNTLGTLSALGLGDGRNFGFTETGVTPYLQAISQFSPSSIGVVTNISDAQFNNPPPDTINPILNTDDEDFGFTLADLNGDGLADLVRYHENVGPVADTGLGGTEILYNTGTTWVDPDGIAAWQGNIGPSGIRAVAPSNVSDVADIGSAFVDLNGDGFPDLIQEEAGDQGFAPGAWINPNQPPVISTFPSGLATPTTANYVSITSKVPTVTYKNDDTTFDPTKYLAIPLQVVASATGADGTGTGLTNTDIYTYHSLRQDPNGRGPLGFDRIEIQDLASDTLTDTRYAQIYPYTGLPADVKKYQLYNFDPSNKHLMSETVTGYCHDLEIHGKFACGEDIPSGAVPAGPLFVFPSVNITTAYLHPEAIDTTGTADTTDAVVTNSQFTYDNLGNATQTSTTTTKTEHCGFDTMQPCATEQFSKTVANTYGTAAEQQQGRPDSTVITGTGGTMSTMHTTTFEYATVGAIGASPSYLELTKTHLEPGAGWPVQLDTAYAYDQFGHEITTTSCANDFASCQPNATAPAQSPPDPIHHPPFRTTSTSYNPSVLGIALNYGPGRFPVTATDAAGHVQTAVYDPIQGEVLTKMDPNGVRTCYSYDAFGRETSETDRCGSSAPLTTTRGWFVAPPPSGQCFVNAENCTARVVAVTTPPSGNPIWTFTDDRDHTVEMLTGAFDGSLVETRTLHDSLGQVSQQSKSFPSTGQPAFTVTVRDNFNRVSTVTDPLGAIDSSNLQKSTTVTTTYNGSAVQVVRTVNGLPQTLTKVMNAIGKVASESKVTETGIVTTAYSYDADGNLTVTADPSANRVSIGYDARGRKQAVADPDMGSWQYCTDGFGDLVGQIDAKNSASTCKSTTLPMSMTYDAIGRMVTKTDATGTAQWVYDVAAGGVGKLAAMVSAPDVNLAGPCTIPLVTATDGNRAGQSYTYDQFGELQQVTECADGQNFVSSFAYDSLGRQSQIRYPAVKQSQLAVGYHYTASGYLQYLTDDSSDYSILWQAKVMNVLGQVTDEQMRNGVETVSTRDPLTGWLLGSTATAHANSDNRIQQWNYAFDEIGNLLTRGRTDAVSALTSQETFGYDLTNRLTSANVQMSNGAVSSNNYAYDPAGLGNLTQKDGNTYTYGASGGCAAGPHAVCSVGGGTLYAYDANGNMTSNGSRAVEYNPSNRVTGIVSEPTPSQGASTVGFMYGADMNRVVQSVASNGTTTRTVYGGLGVAGKSLYEQITTQTGATTTIAHANYIYAGGVHGGNAFALRVLSDVDGSVNETRYYSFDHLGSVTAMSDEEGRVAGTEQDATRFAYDAWGARRNPDESAASSTSFTLPTGGREFTGQEQIPGVGLVNMNGRVYDPSLGRFLSADPNVQDPSDLQSYNRYSYALNNPLKYTDPTGFFWSQLWHDVASPFVHPTFWGDLAITAVGCVVGGPAGCVGAGLLVASLYAGATLGSDLVKAALTVGIGLGVGISSVGSVLKRAGAGIEYVADKSAHIPLIGNLVEEGLALDPMFAIPWALHDFKGWSHQAELGAIVAAGVGLSIMAGGLPVYLMIPADMGIGFGEGFATAKVSGASNGTAFDDGVKGAIIAGIAAGLSAWTQDLDNGEYEYRLEHGMQESSFSGLESPDYTAAGDGSTLGENGSLGHSGLGQFLSDDGYSASHDYFCRLTFDSWLGPGTLNSILTVGTNFGPWEAVFFGTEIAPVVTHDMSEGN
jgi:RHS repeat-associated protein